MYGMAKKLHPNKFMAVLIYAQNAIAVWLNRFWSFDMAE